MSTSVITAPRRARHRGEPAPVRVPGARRVLLAAATLAVALLAGLTTNALWSAGDTAPIGLVVSGDLDLEPVGAMTWTETNPDGTPGDAIDPATYRAMPGDRFTLEQPFVTRLEGDNIVGALTLGWADVNRVPPGVRLDYRVLDGAGEPVSIEGFTAEGAPKDLALSAGEQTWSFVVDVEIPTGLPAVRSAESFTLGPLSLHLDQVLDPA